jgi:hypothetical protein
VEKRRGGHDVKRIASIVMALLLVTGAATGVHSQSAESAPAENSSAQVPAETQTITRRITKVDVKAGTFSVTDRGSENPVPPGQKTRLWTEWSGKAFVRASVEDSRKEVVKIPRGSFARS